MSRTIITLSDTPTGIMVRLRNAPGVHPQSRTFLPLGLDVAALPRLGTPDAVRAHGKALFDALNGHPGVRSALAAAFQAPPTETRPILFEVDAKESEAYPLESIFDASFRTLDRRWPVARLVEAPTPIDLAPRPFDGRLRLMAILSARGHPAGPEWEALVQAVDAARANGLAIDVHAVVGEGQLYQDLDAAVRSGRLKDTTVSAMPSDAVALETLAARWRPHILHVFCIGNVVGGVRELQFGTRADEVAGSTTGSVGWSVDRIANQPDLQRNLWLAVLNCCSSAHPAEGPSMARCLLEAGIPAVVGNLRPVDPGDASVFTGAFYEAALDAVLAATRAGAAESSIDWLGPLYPSRARLEGRHRIPETNLQWALPVLYVGGGDFRVRKGSDEPGVRRNDALSFEVAGLMRALPPGTPPHVVEGLLRLASQGSFPGVP